MQLSVKLMCDRADTLTCCSGHTQLHCSQHWLFSGQVLHQRRPLDVLYANMCFC
jgi:hypothetical protein